MHAEPGADDVDVIIVGAGISGIGAAVRIQQACPSLSYRILEARHASGGTWDLFRYPGVRSDSDMFTLAFPFAPWRGRDSIADGEDILAYLRQTADDHGVSAAIDYDSRVRQARWATPDQRWTLTVASADGARREVRARFVYVCGGYYDAEQAHDVEWPGRDDFSGQVIHPQFWPEDPRLDGRRVVVIGSGATAITLVPALAERAAEVIMVQRSPSYVISVPRRDRWADRLRARLPARLAHRLIRARNIAVSTGLYSLSRRRPATARRVLLQRLGRVLPPSMITDHFSPRYDVWDQRLCATPSSALFKALSGGRARVITDEIERWEPEGIRLRDHGLLEADVIITATGLEMVPLGGICLEVDGVAVDLADTFAYRGCLLSGVPNLAAALGYANNSWTLRVDLVSRYVARLLSFMQQRRYGVAVPMAPDGLEVRPWLPLTSGYVRRGIARFPKVGDRDPWLVRQNYPLELVAFRRADVSADMSFLSAPSSTTRLPTGSVPRSESGSRPATLSQT